MNFEYSENIPTACPSSVACPEAMDKKVKSETIPVATKNVSEPNDNAAALQRTFAFIEMLSNVLGWRFSYDWKSNSRHWFACILIAFVWSQCIYSQIKYFVNGEYNRIFEVFAVYGMISSKIWIFVKYHKEVAALHMFSIKITRQAGRHMAEKFEAQQLMILQLFKLIIFIGILVELLYLYYPTTEFLYHRKLVPLVPIEMMFLDSTKISDFLIQNAIMSVGGVYAAISVLTIDLNFTAAILNCSIQVALIDDDIRRLDTFWRDPKTTTLVERHMLLRNICQKCQDKDNYTEEIKKLFDRPIFWYFCVAYTAQIICLYEIKMENWISGYGIACGNFLEMLLYCLIGTKASIINEQLCYVLTQSNWYTYDIHSQKMVKSIYSYYTFLSEAI